MIIIRYELYILRTIVKKKKKSFIQKMGLLSIIFFGRELWNGPPTYEFSMGLWAWSVGRESGRALFRLGYFWVGRPKSFLGVALGSKSFWGSKPSWSLAHPKNRYVSAHPSAGVIGYCVLIGRKGVGSSLSIIIRLRGSSTVKRDNVTVGEFNLVCDEAGLF